MGTHRPSRVFVSCLRLIGRVRGKPVLFPSGLLAALQLCCRNIVRGKPALFPSGLFAALQLCCLDRVRSAVCCATALLPFLHSAARVCSPCFRLVAVTGAMPLGKNIKKISAELPMKIIITLSLLNIFYSPWQ